MSAPVNYGSRQLVLSKIVPGLGYQSRCVGKPMPADAAAVLFGQLVDHISPSIAPDVMRACEAEDYDLCGTVTGGGYLHVQRPGAPIPGSAR